MQVPATPMPANAFPEIGPLILAAKADGIDPRMVLARVLTDLFVGRVMHTNDELVQFEALIEPLIRIVDVQTGLAVAAKLAPHVETPRGVLEALLAREDEVSFAVLRDAITLDRRTLDILAEQGSGLVAAAIATRNDIAETTARILVYRDELPVDLALAQKPRRDLPGDVVSLLCARARGDLALAKLLLERPSLGLRERCALFLEAEPHERAAIAAEATRRGFLTRGRPSPYAREELEMAIHELAGQGNEKVVEALASWLGVSLEDARRIVEDSTGEPLVIALRACGARPEPIVTLLLRRGVHLSRSVERIFSLERLARETSGAAALMVLEGFAQFRARPLRHVAAQRPFRETPMPSAEPVFAGSFKRRERSR
ncbi:MAG: DUF2336 domain-containing protein [Hyphomicrobiales bacterium]|nr:DUF2336 domain-containing protein [Hyphomicrobiales bacterium]